jgi:alkylation response protein AidB-like acyl-CoA dehydrogenase
MREAVADVRRGLLEVISRLDASSAATLATLRAERTALSATVSSERAAVISAADAQRKAFAQDVAGIAKQVVTDSGIEVRRLAREVTLLLIVLSVILLGLPFAAGYLLGRALRAQDRQPTP